MNGAHHRAVRRRVLAHGGRLAAAMACGWHLPRAGAQHLAQAAHARDAGWFQAAEAMKQLALSWGDQPYGAVLVIDGAVVGEGPSRVVKHKDPSAHAECEAIRDAQRKLGRRTLDGSVLVSTSRPCGECEAAAAEAGVARMLFGAQLTDAGRPQAQTRTHWR